MRKTKGTTQNGYENRKGQTVIRATGKAGNDYEQKIYVLKCKYCSLEYGANGSDIHLRRCPNSKCLKNQTDKRIGAKGLDF